MKIFLCRPSFWVFPLFIHDGAAALVADGNIIAAAQEERFTRKKHDFNFPKQAVDYCLREAGIQSEDLNYVPSKPPARKKRAGLFREFIGMMRENKKLLARSASADPVAVRRADHSRSKRSGPVHLHDLLIRWIARVTGVSMIAPATPRRARKLRP
jgi:predicted NodU family carbamoyl transferase